MSLVQITSKDAERIARQFADLIAEKGLLRIRPAGRQQGRLRRSARRRAASCRRSSAPAAAALQIKGSAATPGSDDPTYRLHMARTIPVAKMKAQQAENHPAPGADIAGADPARREDGALSGDPPRGLPVPAAPGRSAPAARPRRHLHQCGAGVLRRRISRALPSPAAGRTRAAGNRLGVDRSTHEARGEMTQIAADRAPVRLLESFCQFPGVSIMSAPHEWDGGFVTRLLDTTPAILVAFLGAEEPESRLTELILDGAMGRLCVLRLERARPRGAAARHGRCLRLDAPRRGIAAHRALERRERRAANARDGRRARRRNRLGARHREFVDRLDFDRQSSSRCRWPKAMLATGLWTIGSGSARRSISRAGSRDRTSRRWRGRRLPGASTIPQ